MVCVGFRIFYGDDSWYQYILINRGTVYKIKSQSCSLYVVIDFHFDIMELDQVRQKRINY